MSLSRGSTPKEYTGIGSAVTNMMRIVGGAIGPVVTTVILASATISITVDNVEKSYPSPVTYNILYFQEGSSDIEILSIIY